MVAGNGEFRGDQLDLPSVGSLWAGLKRASLHFCDIRGENFYRLQWAGHNDLIIFVVRAKLPARVVWGRIVAMRNKRKLLVGLASLTLFDLSAAAAADLPLKARMRAPVAAPTVVDWSGLYIGGHVGYRWADAKFSSPAYDFDPGSGAITFPARNESFGANTPIVGVQAGYNYMLSPTILAGVEGDWSWGSGSDTTTRFFSGSSNDGFTFRGASELELTWQATIRGRLGVVNGPWLFYGTGGVAFLHAKWTDSSRLQTFFDGTTNAVWSTSKTLVGWTLGAGVEHMYTANWIGRVEYLYENFGDFTVPHSSGPQTGTVDLSDVHKLRVAISYKFGR